LASGMTKDSTLTDNSFITRFSFPLF